MPSVCPVFAATRPLTTTFVLVPMSVHRPPRITAAFIGMRSFDTLRRCFLAQSRIAGTIRATTGVLFMNAESTAGAIIVRRCAEPSDVGRPSARSTRDASAPVRSTAAATTNSAATVSMPSLLMPLNASSGVSTPAARSTTTPPIMAMSGARCPKSSPASVTNTTAAVSAACQSRSRVSKREGMEEEWAASRRPAPLCRRQPQSARANPLPGPPADNVSRDSLAGERCPRKPSALIDVLVDG